MALTELNENRLEELLKGYTKVDLSSEEFKELPYLAVEKLAAIEYPERDKKTTCWYLRMELNAMLKNAVIKGKNAHFIGGLARAIAYIEDYESGAENTIED